MSEFEGLISAAKQARENAYAPFSNFRVGAAVRAGSGRTYTGCNIENATLGLTICAEFCGDIPVLLTNLEGKVEKETSAGLLPRQFDSSFL
jgi:cytidine deaminase